VAAAEEDLTAAELILAGSLPSYRLVSFHAQQTAEKALKALLIRHAIEFRKTHSIGELLRLAEPVAPGLADTLVESRELTPYAARARYPGEDPPVDRDEARQHVDLARTVLVAVQEQLRPYLDAGRPDG
jgi:HEPN domain-containing protein